MTDLNLFIANVLEPAPRWSAKAGYGQLMLSDGMAWTSDGNGYRYCDCSNCESRRKWQPRSFSTDPAAILMLMERMIDEEGFWEMCDRIASSQAVIDDGTSASLRQGVAEAFARAHGYKEESQ